MGTPMSEPIDISVRLRADMPVWPGSVGFHMGWVERLEDGAVANVTRLDMDVHCGTHVEGPLHVIEGGAPLESYPLDVFVGLAWVADLRDAHHIGPAELERASIPDEFERVLMRTRNSSFWREPTHEFRTDFAALTRDGAAWMVERRMRLVGADYLSVQLFDEDLETHRILLRGGGAILEGLDLGAVEPGPYRLTCLPLRIAGGEAAPARAILEPLA
jgi:arylformamidase